MYHPQDLIVVPFVEGLLIYEKVTLKPVFEGNPVREMETPADIYIGLEVNTYSSDWEGFINPDLLHNQFMGFAKENIEGYQDA